MQPMAPEIVSLAVTCANGEFVIHHFIVNGRGNVLPSGAKWASAHQWYCAPTDKNIQDELDRAFHDRPVVSWRRLSPGEIPVDRTFRGAWKDDGSFITHDLGAAKDIKRQHIRHERARALPELDGQWMRAHATGMDTALVERKRQQWRDAPADPRIDAARTIEELAAIPLP